MFDKFKQPLYQGDDIVIGGDKVVTEQQPAVATVTTPDASGTDAALINELKQQLNDLLVKLRAHGLIAT